MPKGRQRRGLSLPSSNYMLGGGWQWTQIALQKMFGRDCVWGAGTGGIFLDDGFVYYLLGVRLFSTCSFSLCAVEFLLFCAVELLLLRVRSNYCFCVRGRISLSGGLGDEYYIFMSIIRGRTDTHRERACIIPNILIKNKKSL